MVAAGVFPWAVHQQETPAVAASRCVVRIGLGERQDPARGDCDALLDVDTGHVFLRDNGFDTVLTFGHSGGGALFAYYIEQAALEPQRRIDVTPAGRPIVLSGAQMPRSDAAVFYMPRSSSRRIPGRASSYATSSTRRS